MSIERPTFSENWHRVAELKPRLRAAVRTHRQYYRGRMWHVLADPISNQFFRLDEPAFRFMALLDGQRTVAEAWRITNEDMGDAAPTQGEAIQLLGQLYTSNLLQAEMPPDSAQMFARYHKRIKREVSSYLMNFLFARFPIFNPHPLLKHTTHIVGKIFNFPGFLIWCAVLLAAFVSLAGRWSDLLKAASPQELLVWDNVLLLGLCFIVIKAIHEMGHAYCCSHFGRITGSGGDVHTIGIMLMVLMPVPYVDASSSWTFRNKWHRAFVAAAGMYVELFVAAIAAIVWVNSTPGSLLNALAYNVVFIASISTLLFNGNPLLRFDGYYILCDLTEIANLAQRSKQYLQYLVKRYAYGVRHVRNPAHSTGEMVWLPIYGVASFVYRIFISIAIFIYIFNIFPFFGVVMALMALAGWVVVPVGKFVKYLTIDGEVERTRARATLVSVATLSILFVLFGLIPMPDRDRAQGVVDSAYTTTLYTQAAGQVQSLLPSSTEVTPDGPPILVADNPRLENRRTQLQAELQSARIERDLARNENPDYIQALDEQVEASEKALERVEQELASLTLHAPHAGTWSSPDAHTLLGAFFQKAQPLGQITDRKHLIVKIAADQTVDPEIIPGKTTVELRVLSNPEILIETKDCSVKKVLPASQENLPSPSLAMPAGGSMPVDASDPSGARAAVPFQEIHIELSEDASKRLLPGQRVVARFNLPNRPLLSQLIRSIRQLFQTSFS